MPVSGAAGCRAISTASPLCSATPEQRVTVFRVRCEIRLVIKFLLSGDSMAERSRLAAFHWAKGRPARGVDPSREVPGRHRSEEHTSELQSLMRISYAVLCLHEKK